MTAFYAMSRAQFACLNLERRWFGLGFFEGDDKQDLPRRSKTGSKDQQALAQETIRLLWLLLVAFIVVCQVFKYLTVDLPFYIDARTKKRGRNSLNDQPAAAVQTITLRQDSLGNNKRALINGMASQVVNQTLGYVGFCLCMVIVAILSVVGTAAVSNNEGHEHEEGFNCEHLLRPELNTP